MFSTLFPMSHLNNSLPRKSLWDQIHGPMLARIWTSECIRGFSYEPNILSLVYVSTKCSIIGADLRLFMRPILCILCELTSECLYSASVDWCPVAVEVHYVHSWSAFVSEISTERSQVSVLQHLFCMWTIAWERVMSGVIGIKSMFLILTKMLDRQNHINGDGRCLRSLSLHPAGPFPPCWITCAWRHIKNIVQPCNGAPFGGYTSEAVLLPDTIVSPCPGLCLDLAENFLPYDQLTE